MSTVDDLLAVQDALGKDAWLAQMLDRKARGDTGTLDAYLCHLEPPISINGTKAQCRNYFVVTGLDGRIRVEELTRKLVSHVVDYCIPRTRIEEAADAMRRHGSTSELMHLQNEAQRLFTHLSTSGEGGELLLYLLLEAVLRIPQVLCKMSLKTNSQMHVHGADGVHATALEGGGLAVYWGESKLHASVADAVRTAMKDLAEFLVGDLEHRRRDMLLLRDHTDLGDPLLTEALKTFFDEGDINSSRVEFRGACLVGFDLDDYPNMAALEADMEEKVRAAVRRWVTNAQASIGNHALDNVVLEIFFVPFPSVAEFRDLMRKELGA